MKLETQRNTNLDIAGYLYDIGRVKLTAAVCVCKHLLACTANNGFLWECRTHHGWDKEAAVKVSFCPLRQYYLIIQICIRSLSSVTAESKLGLCINYSFFARSPPGPEDMGNYSLCQWSRWTPADEETCWWGHRACDSPPRTLTLTPTKPLAPSFLRPPFALLPLELTPLLSSLLDVKGCEEVGACLSFSPLSVGSPLKTQRHLAIIILSLLLPKASLVGNFYPTFSQVKSTYSPGLMATRKSHPREWEKKKQIGTEGGKELRLTRFLLNDSMSPCSCLNEIRKCASS